MYIYICIYIYVYIDIYIYIYTLGDLYLFLSRLREAMLRMPPSWGQSEDVHQVHWTSMVHQANCCDKNINQFTVFFAYSTNY